MESSGIRKDTGWTPKILPYAVAIPQPHFLAACGDFIEHRATSFSKQVGRIVDIALTQDKVPQEHLPLKHNKNKQDHPWLLVNCYLRGNLLEEAPTPDYDNYPAAQGMEHVVKTDLAVWISVLDVVDIAFVFHIQEINERLHYVNGMRNGYCIAMRMGRMGEEDPFPPLSRGSHRPFGSTFGVHFPERVFSALLAV